ncbi:hypothetical protein CDD83_9513 [Cordyceps sp. RAO-2017]|nr:hypothetical protein CDD83_9513 [Cordyceps sp. RAO-2017]
MAVKTLHSGSKAIPYLPMTDSAIPCPGPVLIADFQHCRVPGGVELWERGGFYSPGVCFAGYKPSCTQTAEPSDGWPLRAGETAVRCVPEDYDCNAEDGDQRYATSALAGTVLSVPAFEIRWRSEDLAQATRGSTVARSSHDALPSQTVTIAATTRRPGSGTVASTKGTAESIKGTVDSASTSDPPSTVARTVSLSPGYIVAIAVGSCAGLLALVVSAFLWMTRYRHKSKTVSTEMRDPGPAESREPHNNQPVEIEHRPVGPRELPANSTDPSLLSSNPPPTGRVQGLFEMTVEPVNASCI